MSRPKSPERILLDQERAIRKERREQKREEKETRRLARETKRLAGETYDAKNGTDHEMKRSEFHPRLCCQGCGGFGVATKWLPGVGPVCPECFDLFNGRATPADKASPAGGPKAQLALFEISGVAPDLLGQGKDLGGSERRTREILSLSKS